MGNEENFEEATKQINEDNIPEVVAWLYRKIHQIERCIPTGKTKLIYPLRCGSSLGKNELANLFYILLDEGILFFDDTDPPRSRSLMQDFIEKNFSYAGDRGIQTPITSVSKEFSECKGYSYKDKQLRFLNKILKLLEKRKQRLVLK